MITLEAIRGAILAPDPYTQMDRLIRAEMDSGRKVKEIFEEIKPLIDQTLGTPGLTEDGEEAFLGTIDALTGNCRSDQCYRDPPRTDLPSEQEITELPQWARVAFAARCARRTLSFFLKNWPTAPASFFPSLMWAVEECERSANRAGVGLYLASPMAAVALSNYVCDAVINALRNHERVIEVVRVIDVVAERLEGLGEIVYATLYPVLMHNTTVAIAGSVAHSHETYEYADLAARHAVCRDFENLTSLAKWQRWADDTAVSPDLFGPLWPEGLPSDWSANPDVPQRTDLPLELVSAARVLEQMTEDDMVRVFNAINAYYIARTGDRLTLEDLRPLIAAGVPVADSDDRFGLEDLPSPIAPGVRAEV